MDLALEYSRNKLRHRDRTRGTPPSVGMQTNLDGTGFLSGQLSATSYLSDHEAFSGYNGILMKSTPAGLMALVVLQLPPI